MPLDAVIEFKRGVYEMALTELARYLPRINPHNRYLRSGMRSHRDFNGDEPHGSSSNAASEGACGEIDKRSGES